MTVYSDLFILFPLRTFMAGIIIVVTCSCKVVLYCNCTSFCNHIVTVDQSHFFHRLHHLFLVLVKQMVKSKKRKKKTDGGSGGEEGLYRLVSVIFFHHPCPLGNPQPIVPRAACSRCKSRKIKCEYAAGSDKCQRCITASVDESCAPPPAKANGRGPSNMSKPSSALVKPQKQQVHGQPSDVNPRKCSRSRSVTFNPHNSKPLSHPSNLKLVSIAGNPPACHSVVPKLSIIDEEIEDNIPDAMVKSFTSAIFAESAQDTVDGTYDNEDSTSASDGEMEIDLDSDIQPPTPQIRKQAVAQSTKKKPGPKPKASKAKTSDSEDEGPDPATCGNIPCSLCCARLMNFPEFTITAAVKVREGNLLPFEIKSTVFFDSLHILIAEKLQRFPGLVQLCYRLSTDKQKDSAISIQTAEHLTIFISRMRPLIVPQKLPSGKISTRQLKAISVIFEDTSIENTLTGTGKKVHALS